MQVVLQALSVLPGDGSQRQLAMRCELRAEAGAPEPPAEADVDLAAELAALTGRADELAQVADASRDEATCAPSSATSSTSCAARPTAPAASGTSCAASWKSRSAISTPPTDPTSGRASWNAPARRGSSSWSAWSPRPRASETAAARAQGQLAATTEELSALRTELDALRLRTTTQGADAERTAVRYAAIETSARQAIEELKAARGEAQRLTRERDQAIAAVEAERARADAAVAAVRDEPKKPRKLVSDDAAAVSTAKLQRQIDELRAEVKQEQDARKELEELLDQNAANLEQTIQDYEERLEALGAGVDDKRPAKPKKSPGARRARANPQRPTPNSQGTANAQLPNLQRGLWELRIGSSLGVGSWRLGVDAGLLRRESRPRHRAPAALPAQEVVGALDPPPRRQLAEAEVLDDPEADQQQQIPDPLVAAVGDLLEHHRGQRDQRAVDHRQQEHQLGVAPVDQAVVERADA